MAVKTLHNQDGTWFVTFTCYNWIPLFEITQSYNMVYNWLKLIADRYDVETFAFVIMPNHVHLLINLPENANLNKIISNGKRFMAYEMVAKLTAANNNTLLEQLAKGCTSREILKGQKHKVFEPSFDAKLVSNSAFLYQKLDYIHHNPVRGKWSLASDFISYRHSSAAFYHAEKPHEHLDISDYRNFWVDTDVVSSQGR